MKQLIILIYLLCFFSFSTIAEDRQDIVKTINNFYLGDITGSKSHKKMSMSPNGAYRFVNKKGEYKESAFKFEESSGDTSYTYELLSVDIFENVAAAKLRLASKKNGKPEYKLMLLHKEKSGWKITTIVWGYTIIQ